MITFGEVIKYKEAEYVYLAATEEIIYLARILNLEDGDKINKLYLLRQSAGIMTKPQILNSPLYCFVILTTDNFKDRMAHFHQPGHDFGPEMNFDIIGRLNSQDLKEIKQTIMTGPVPIELKELVNKIEV